MPLLNRFGIFFLIGLLVTYINAFFMWSDLGKEFLTWWADNFSDFYRALFPQYFALGPPAILVQALALLFCASFNTFAVVATTYIWDYTKKR